MKKIYLFLSFVLALNTAYSQCMLYPVSLPSKISNSQLIVEGKVIARNSFWNSSYDFIYTSNLVSVTQVLKGNTTASFIEIMTIGGEIGFQKITASTGLELTPGEAGIFMLNSATHTSQYGYGVYQVYSEQQGFYKFNETGGATEPFKTYASANADLREELQSLLKKNISFFNTGHVQGKQIGGPVQINAINAMPVTNITPTTITAGTASQLTITGSGFGPTQGSSYVAFRNADAGTGSITAHSTQYISWSPTQIVVQIPTKTSVCGTAGTGPVTVNIAGTPMVSSQTLNITYGHLNVYFSNTVTPATQIFNTRHHNQNGTGGMTWRMNTNFNANTPAKNDFQTAFGKWRCATYINWQIGPTVATNTIAGDGINVIGFDNQVGPQLGAGILGVCYSYWGGCTSGTNIAWHVAELDIVFDDAVNWQFGAGAIGGAQYDFESVVLHELGHGHQLSHVINTVDVMHYALANGQNNSTLNIDDISGGNAVMARNLSGGVCGNAVMVALNAGNCALAAPVASFNPSSPVCVGQVVNFTDLSNNTPNVWSWNMPGGSPATSTLQNPSTTYATAGVKSITLTATNGNGSNTIVKSLTVVASPTISVTSNSICSGASATLSASSNGTSYVWSPGGMTGATQNLSPGSTQVYTVVASLGSCTSASTGTMNVTPTPMVGATNTTVCNGSAAVMTATGATSYTWYPGGLTGASQVFSPSVTTTYTINGVNGVCTGSGTTVLNVIDCTTGISQHSLQNNAVLYPNPTKDVFTLKFDAPFTGDVKVFNALGKVIISKKVTAVESLPFNLSDYSKGIYPVKITAADNTSKIIKVVKE